MVRRLVDPTCADRVPTECVLCWWPPRRRPCLAGSAPLTARCPPDTTTSSSSCSSVTLVSESRACSSALPTTHTQRATSQPSVSTSCVAPRTCCRRRRSSNLCQKIRTIELDGKTVKLQIVRARQARPASPSHANRGCSGIPLARSDSGPSHPPTTVVPTVSASSTMSPTWTRSTT